ncbi:hypothetical protein BDV96DRAFT_495688 [Lophiotrema nucula]|uniref:F-box domain-containing protein n=1 Tax=Lophiotrema nucula TaxID=690887 RepID=A0A6A5Z3E1_9PLEO|nr:hypothetical protein BDV96DRAFT_495688 [Lophiotrema nucula]
MAEPVQSTRLGSRFLELPAELVVEIVAQVANLEHARKSLCALAQTCRYLQPLAESYIYTTIELFETDDLLAILDAFNSRPARVETIHTLKILYKFRDNLDDTVVDRGRFNNHVVNMKALKEWHIESPCDNYNWNRGGALWVRSDMEAFRHALEAASLHVGDMLNEEVGLGKLEKLIVHSHGPDSDFWDFDGFDCLFRHPRLHYLHISSVILGSTLPALEPFSRATPLSTLVFDECIIKPEALDSLLRTPKGLKHLVLGECVWNGWREGRCVANLSSSPDATIRALSHVAHSLKSLTHLDPLERLHPDTSRLPHVKEGSMRTFDRLETIECAPCSFLHRGIILTPHCAPPNIMCVRVRGRRQRVWDEEMGAFFDELPDTAQYPYISSLKRLEFVQPVNMNAEYFTAFRMSSYLCQPEQLRERHAQAYKLWKHGITTVLYAEVHRKSSLIPPYLYGEQTPRLLSIYDAEDVGFHRKLDPDTDMAPSILLENQSVFKRMVAAVIASHNDHPHELDHATASSEKSNEENTAKPDDLPETDQLSNDDILRLKNELRRRIQRCQAEMRATVSDLDDSETDTETDSDGYGGPLLTMDEFSDVEIEFDLDDGFDEGFEESVDTDEDLDEMDEDGSVDLDVEVNW